MCGPGMRWRGLTLKIDGSLVQASQMTWGLTRQPHSTSADQGRNKTSQPRKLWVIWETQKLVDTLPTSTMDALEISGERWKLIRSNL
jgi:hypothetical protein